MFGAFFMDYNQGLIKFLMLLILRFYESIKQKKPHRSVVLKFLEKFLIIFLQAQQQVQQQRQ
jgi:hypothetical protein